MSLASKVSKDEDFEVVQVALTDYWNGMENGRGYITCEDFKYAIREVNDIVKEFNEDTQLLEQ